MTTRTQIFLLRLTLWAFVTASVFSVFGFSFPFRVWVLTICVIPWFLPINSTSRVAIAILLLCGIVFSAPAFLGRVWPHLGVQSDRANIRTVVQDGLFEYRRDYGVFPVSLAELSSESQMRLPPSCLAIRDDHGQCDLSQEGYFAFLFRRRQENRVAKPLWDQFSGEGRYLFVRPDLAAPDNAVLLMTRPGVLYGNAVNVAYVDGNIETFEYGSWMRNTRIQAFLREYQDRQRSRSSAVPGQIDVGVLAELTS